VPQLKLLEKAVKVLSIRKIDAPVITKAFSTNNYYINESPVRSAIDKKSQFNVIDINEGDKIDFWILTGSEFDKSRFSRKQRFMLFNFNVYVSTPEDTILQKLYRSKISRQSLKQYKDALNVYEIQYESLDIEYMDLWAEKLGIKSFFEKIKSEAQPE